MRQKLLVRSERDVEGCRCTALQKGFIVGIGWSLGKIVRRAKLKSSQSQVERGGVRTLQQPFGGENTPPNHGGFPCQVALGTAIDKGEEEMARDQELQKSSG